MQSTHRDLASLLDIVNCCDLIEEWTKGLTRDEVFRNVILQRAILYEITVIGEAVRRISEEFKAAHPEVEWSAMKGMRNHLVHDYDEILEENVWKVVSADIFELRRQLRPLIPPRSEYE
jgi:uncharacterized protein with HEPN domain